jgi:glutamate racemase
MTPRPDPSGPVGVFDSGVGGLSVLRHVRALLPHEDLLYVTATAAAASALRADLAVPIIAMEPAVKPAAAATRSGVVGVLATTGTLESARFAALLGRFAADVAEAVG